MCSLSSGISSRRCVELLSILYTGIIVTLIFRPTSCCMFSHYFEFRPLIVTADFIPYIAFFGAVDFSLQRVQDLCKNPIISANKTMSKQGASALHLILQT